jgi:hypothetical protein
VAPAPARATVDFMGNVFVRRTVKKVVTTVHGNTTTTVETTTTEENPELSAEEKRVIDDYVRTPWPKFWEFILR